MWPSSARLEIGRKRGRRGPVPTGRRDDPMPVRVGTSPIGPPTTTPALLQTTCTAPNASTAAAANASTADRCETSVRTPIASPPSPVTAATAASMPAWSTSETTTRIPSAAKRSTMARPIPLAPPVTTAVLPSRSFMIGLSPRRANAATASPSASGWSPWMLWPAPASSSTRRSPTSCRYRSTSDGSMISERSPRTTSVGRCTAAAWSHPFGSSSNVRRPPVDADAVAAVVPPRPAPFVGRPGVQEHRPLERLP